MWKKRAAQKLYFDKGKILALILLYTVLFSVITVFVILSMASQKQIENMQQNIRNAVLVKKEVLEPYLQHVRPRFDEQEIAVLTESDFVKSYNVFSMGYGQLKNIDAYVDDEVEFEKYREFLESYGHDTLDDSILFGITDSDTSALFVGAGYRILEGTGFGEENGQDKVALISSRLAQKNGLKVGDVIEVSGGTDTYSSREVLVLTIQGIYDYPEQQYVQKYGFKPSMQTANQIFIPYPVLSEFDPTHYGSTLLYIYLKDASLFEGYVEQMEGTLGKTCKDEAYLCTAAYTYSINDLWYQTISVPLMEVSKTSMIMVILISIGIYIMLMFLCSWILKGRRREFGIYISLGERRRNIYKQVLAEMMVPILISVFLSGIFAVLLAPEVSGRLMSDSSAYINEMLEGKREWLALERSGDDRYYMSSDIRDGEFNYFEAPTQIYMKDIIKEFALCIVWSSLFILASIWFQCHRILSKKPGILLTMKV